MKIYMPVEFPEPLMTGWDEDVVLDVDRSGLPVSREVMKAHLKDAGAVVINLDDVFDREMIDAAPELKAIALFAGSTDHIDTAYAREKGIAICTAMGEIYENTADLTFGLLMAAARRIPEADRYVRAGRYGRWEPAGLLGGDIYGKTLGILGLGRIGSAVARRGRGFGMNILYTALHGPKPEAERELGCRYVSKEDLLRQSDFLCLHCKLSAETEHIIGRDELAVMKPGAYLINTGRGRLVDEKALAWALRERVIAGAALDVFEEEPKILPELLELDNVVLTPHLGASTLDNRLGMAASLAKQLRAVLRRAGAEGEKS